MRGLKFLCFGLCLLSPVALASETVDLRPYLTPVKHQGDRGTCSVFAATALVEAVIARDLKQKRDLSENYAYWAGKNLAPDSEMVREMYAHSDGLAGYLAVKAYESGAMFESDWPYESKNWQQTGDPRCRKNHGAWLSECFTGLPPKGKKLAPYRVALEFVDREEIADYLSIHEAPVAMNIMWFFALSDSNGDFKRVPSTSEAKACMDSSTGCGGHVILLVGYDPGTRRFLFRNSWGAEWGRNGYGTIPEDYVLGHCEACYLLKAHPGVAGEQRDFLEKVMKGASARLIAN